MRRYLLGPTMDGAPQPQGEAPRPPLTEIVKATASDLVTLVTAEVKLARLELLSSARHVAGRAGWMAVSAVPLLTAYLLGVVALAVWLHTFWSWAGALAVTAVGQAIVGGGILWAAPTTSTVHRAPAALAGESPLPRSHPLHRTDAPRDAG